MPSVERCIPKYLARHAEHIMPPMRSLLELVDGTGAATKEHTGQGTRNGVMFSLRDVVEAKVDHIVRVVVDGKSAEWLGIKLQVRSHIVQRGVLFNFTGL